MSQSERIKVRGLSRPHLYHAIKKSSSCDIVCVCSAIIIIILTSIICMQCHERYYLKAFQNPTNIFSIITGTTLAVLSRSSPNCRRIDGTMPALLFLQLGWDQSKPYSAGVCCCWRMGRIQQTFICLHSSLWRILDIPRLPSKSIVWCSSFSCGRQDQGDRGFGWTTFHQIWGEK